jgi:hypothetical protein
MTNRGKLVLPKYPYLRISINDVGTSHPAPTKTGFMIVKGNTTKYYTNGYVNCKMFMTSPLI